MKTKTRAYLLGSTLIASAALSTSAFAQTTSQPDAAVQQPAEPTTQGDIVVTGTLIRNPALVSSSPVQVITSDEVQLRGSQTAELILRETPGIIPDAGTSVNNGNAGASNVNLRGLGANRNLVLLDGNRIVPSASDATVDLNVIPLALVKRVDVLTGGASSTYGADAIAGVVNFITRTDFAGLDASASQQITGKGDGNYFRADVTVGANFDDGRGNAVLSVGYQEADAVTQGDRKFSNFAINSNSGLASGASPTSSPTAVAFDDGSFLQSNPTGTALVDQYQGFNFNPYNLLTLPFKRYNVYGAAHYDVSDTVEVYTRGMFSSTAVSTIVAPSGIFGAGLTIPANNPYLNDTIRNQICAAESIAAANCTATSTTALPLPAVYRRLTELGPRIDEFKTQMFDYTAGIRLSLTKSIKLDVSGAYGESNKIHSSSGYTLDSRFQQALNANNTSTCLDTSNNCVPLNLFGPAGSISSSQAAFLNAANADQVNTQLSQAKALLTGDIGYTSPFANDPISFALGGEYRDYGFQQLPGAYAEQGQLGGAGGPVTRFSGSYHVYEAYGEAVVPLVADKPFFYALNLEGGLRYSKYTVESAGSPSFSATTWKAGAQWAPIQAIKFRGDYQHAVRAPNINELFTPVSTILTNLASEDDPCFGPAVTTNANLAAVCRSQGAPANRVANGTVSGPPAGQANVTTGGALNLKPEIADTFTVGVVLQPRNIVPGLTMTVDYYNIKVNKAITTPTPSDVLNGCFDNLTAASATSAACQAIVRNPVNGAIGGDTNSVKGFITNFSNAGRLYTDGIDLNVNFTHDLGPAKLALNFAGNYVFHEQFQSSATSLNRECVGYYSANCSAVSGSIVPQYYWNQRTTLTFGSTDISLLWRHIAPVDYEKGLTPLFSGVITGSGDLVGKSYNFNHINAYNYFDLSARFQATEHFDFVVTVNNLFDRTPPIVGAQAGATAFNSGNTFPSTYDSLGRTFIVSARAHF